MALCFVNAPVVVGQKGVFICDNNGWWVVDACGKVIDNNILCLKYRVFFTKISIFKFWSDEKVIRTFLLKTLNAHAPLKHLRKFIYFYYVFHNTSKINPRPSVTRGTL